MSDMTTSQATMWVPSDDEFGARLALIRQRMGWNMKEAALACNVSQASWREWEAHNRKPRDLAQIAERIAWRTGVDDYWLMTGRPSGSPNPGGGSSIVSYLTPPVNHPIVVPRRSERSRGGPAVYHALAA